MPKKDFVENPTFSFNLNRVLEQKLQIYIEGRKKQEISGGLLGDIKGKKQNQLTFEIKEFLPFPNLAEDKTLYAKPPEIWFNIFEEWRLFNYKNYKFIGFLHTHLEGSSKISKYDQEFADYLREKYGTLIFVIISENKNFRCYLFNDRDSRLVYGKLNLYHLIEK